MVYTCCHAAMHRHPNPPSAHHHSATPKLGDLDALEGIDAEALGDDPSQLIEELKKQVRAGENKQVEELQRQLDETEKEKKRLLENLSEKDERLAGRQQLLGDYKELHHQVEDKLDREKEVLRGALEVMENRDLDMITAWLAEADQLSLADTHEAQSVRRLQKGLIEDKETIAAITAAAEAEDLDTLNHLLAVAAGRQLDQRVEVDNAMTVRSRLQTQQDAVNALVLAIKSNDHDHLTRAMTRAQACGVHIDSPAMVEAVAKQGTQERMAIVEQGLEAAMAAKVIYECTYVRVLTDAGIPNARVEDVSYVPVSHLISTNRHYHQLNPTPTPSNPGPAQAQLAHSGCPRGTRRHRGRVRRCPLSCDHRRAPGQGDFGSRISCAGHRDGVAGSAAEGAGGGWQSRIQRTRSRRGTGGGRSANLCRLRAPQRHRGALGRVARDGDQRCRWGGRRERGAAWRSEHTARDPGSRGPGRGEPGSGGGFEIYRGA